jgi:hypothetical protein
VSNNSKYYGGIPDPRADLESLRQSAARTKEIIETLTRQRLPTSAAAVTWQDLVDLEVIAASRVPASQNSSISPLAPVEADPEPAEVVIETVPFSAVSAVDIDLPGGYSSYKLLLHSLSTTATSANINLRLSADGGSSFYSAAGDYEYSTTYRYEASTSGQWHGAGDGASNAIYIGFLNDGDTSDTMNAELFIFDAADTATTTKIIGQATSLYDNDWYSLHIGGHLDYFNAVNALRLLDTDGGTITGIYTLVGLR